MLDLHVDPGPFLARRHLYDKPVSSGQLTSNRLPGSANTLCLIKLSGM